MFFVERSLFVRRGLNLWMFKVTWVSCCRIGGKLLSFFFRLFIGNEVFLLYFVVSEGGKGED